jgi:hypothetical protein
MGLVSRVVPDDRVADEARATASASRRRTAGGARWHKRFARQRRLASRCRPADIDAAFDCFDTEDFRTGYRAFLAKETPKFNAGCAPWERPMSDSALPIVQPARCPACACWNSPDHGGPTCGMMLADLGADVIKIEKIDGGDDARGYREPTIKGVSAPFLMLNRNKRGIALT